ncbi:olfactory receptor 3A1-like [Oenanthe melanoleuca]|uniref:olfactory receptor 3A1-like n=1 Tax=Oenanthe melanoleuca TaxID=2939378 RepID=UPI0024C1B292|nr:olfactory receptor 3A1-like [Oenanthe melanoleuca]
MRKSKPLQNAVACGHHLHTPMFFFLLNLALSDLGCICTTVPLSMSSPSLDLALSVLYSVVSPALNPLIYSLRNQELKAAVWRLVTGKFQKR